MIRQAREIMRKSMGMMEIMKLIKMGKLRKFRMRTQIQKSISFTYLQMVLLFVKKVKMVLREYYVVMEYIFLLMV